MIDFQATAAALYPNMVQEVPAVPPGEAKTTSETPTPAQTTTTEQNSVGYALTLPQETVLEARAIERTAAFAKAAGLSPEAAQQALEHANGEVAAYQNQQNEAWTKLTRETWVNDVKADPEIGGAKYTGAVADAKRFLAAFGDEEVRQFLDDTGFGNNKFVIRMLSRAAKRMASDNVLTGGPGGAVEHKTVVQQTYPYMNP